MAAELTIRRGSEWQWTATGWERAHRLALLAMLASVFTLTFADGTERGLHLTVFFTGLSALGLGFSRLFEPGMVDFLRGLSPRDCVLFFLLHGVVLAVPGFLGYPEWSVAVAALISFVCFVAIDKLGFGRLHAASVVLAIIVCASEPLPPFEPLAAWIFFFLLCYRLEHIATRLSRYGEGRSVPVVPASVQTFVWLVLPWAALTLLFAWLTPQMAPHTRFLVFEFGARTPADAIVRETNIGRLIRDLVILGVLVGILAYVVWWFERRLGLRRRGRSTEVGPTVKATSAMVRSTGKRPTGPKPDLPKDARGRILARFKALGESFSREGWGRERSETAAEYLERVWRELHIGADGVSRGLSPFQQACYSPMEMAEEDAEGFVQWAARAETEVHARAEERRRAEAEDDATP